MGLAAYKHIFGDDLKYHCCYYWWWWCCRWWWRWKWEECVCVRACSREKSEIPFEKMHAKVALNRITIIDKLWKFPMISGVILINIGIEGAARMRASSVCHTRGFEFILICHCETITCCVCVFRFRVHAGNQNAWWLRYGISNAAESNSYKISQIKAIQIFASADAFCTK